MMDLSNVHNLAITGANGFVGRSIVDLLDSLPQEFLPEHVTLITRKGLNYQIGESLSKKCTQVSQDLTKTWELPQTISHLVNLAADGTSEPYSQQACEHFDVISENLTSWISKSNRDIRVFHASSGACFGFKGLNKNKNIDETKVAFASNRISVENKLVQRSEELGFELSIGRLFSFSGKHILNKRQYAISNFIQAALQTGTINVLGDPLTQRSYLHQTSMSEWILKALVASEQHRDLQIGSNIAVTIRQLAELISLNTTAQISYTTNPKIGDIYIPDNSSTRTKLEVEEGIGWEKAVLEMIADARTMNYV